MIEHEDVITEEGGDLMERRIAAFSRDRLYRYALSICWLIGAPVLVVIMLNPSTADHNENDPTIARICKRAKLLGFGGVLILNLFAWRETNRLVMLKVSDPIGQLNDAFIEAGLLLAKASGRVMVGWGNEGGHRARSADVAAMLGRVGLQAYCVNYCANGQPGHPLYVSYDAPLMPWPKPR